jgi:hypothetical protein
MSALQSQVHANESMSNLGTRQLCRHCTSKPIEATKWRAASISCGERCAIKSNRMKDVMCSGNDVLMSLTNHGFRAPTDSRTPPPRMGNDLRVIFCAFELLQRQDWPSPSGWTRDVTMMLTGRGAIDKTILLLGI